MSTSDRVQHTGLVTQQRRLRHLSSLSARNIQVVPDAMHKEKETLMETYFTLHIWPSCETVYTSEKIHNSLNPTWRSFDLQMSCPDMDASQSTILVRVWGGQNSECSLVIEWLVNLRGLCYLGAQIHKDGMRYQPNSVIFGMFEGYYGASDNLLDSTRIDSQFQTSIEVEQSAAILSYKTFSLGRLHTTQRAIRQTEASVSKVRSSIVEKLNLAKEKTLLHSEMESLKLRLGILKYELEQQEIMLTADCKRCTKNRESIDAKVQDHKLRCERLESEQDEFTNQNQLLQERKEQLQKLSAKYAARKTTLIGELSDIYPVVEVTNNEHTILGIRLPNAENYSGTDDMVVSTGLGHTCHLILMMSQILKLPLRYPMVHYGSRSLVRDHITEALADKDRDFPLYSRGKERFQFNYALYLLNRNIAQLRFAMGVQTTDLRATLPNLKTLLELKWGIKTNASNMIYQAPRSLLEPDRSEVVAQQQQELPPVSSTPYPVQAPPVYSQVNSSRLNAQHDTPPPPYHPPEVRHSPSPSPYEEQNSPFEDLTPDTEPLASLPIPIPSVDMAAKAIEAKQAMHINHHVDGRTIQTTAVIEPYVAALSLEEPLNDTGSTETLEPTSMVYQGKQNSWPSTDLVEGTSNSRLEPQPLDPLAASQVQISEQPEMFSSTLADQENILELPCSDSQERLPESSPEEELDSFVLPKFAPSGQLNVSVQPTPATISTTVEQDFPTNTNNHYKSRAALTQLSLMPIKPEPSNPASPLADKDIPTTQTPLLASSSSSSKEDSNSSDNMTTHSMQSQSQSSPKNSFKTDTSPASSVDSSLKLLDPTGGDRFSTDAPATRHSSVGIELRESDDATYSMDTDTVYQFDDLGSRTEALSRHESFSSFRKSPGQTKAQKFGKT